MRIFKIFCRHTTGNRKSVKKWNYCAKYGERTKAVICGLSDKYADDGLVTIERKEVLKPDPLNKLGTPIELIKAFGIKAKYFGGIKRIRKEFYKTGA